MFLVSAVYDGVSAYQKRLAKSVNYSLLALWKNHFASLYNSVSDGGSKYTFF